MEKSSNSSKIVGDAFRGPSGYETVDEQPLPETRGRVLGLGLLAAAVILCAVVFVAVPSPSSGAGANTHGLAMRCVDNSARVVPRPSSPSPFGRGDRAAAGASRRTSSATAARRVRGRTSPAAGTARTSRR